MTGITQSDFTAGLLDADVPAPDGLTDAAGKNSPRRYAVYRNNVFMSLRDALGDAFPAVKKLIGETNFNHVAAGYLRRNPPESPLMMYYGATFPDHLASIQQLSHIGYLSDVARLEQAMRHAYHAQDGTPADPAVLATLNETQLLATRFEFAPACQILTSSWPVVSLYNFTLLPDQPKPQAQAQDVLVTRPEFDPVPHVIPQGGYPVIAALKQGDTLGRAIEKAGSNLQLEPVLSLLLVSGAITKFIPNEET